MWKPIDIEFKNLFSHEHTKFTFKQGELIMILGDNGAGKSAIIEAIHLLFTGSVYRGNTNKRYFIRRREEELYIKGSLYNEQLKQKFTIERYIYAGDKSALLNLYEDGVKLKKFAKRTPAAQKYIWEKIGLNEEDMFNYFIINQDNNNTFLGSSDTAQKQVILRFSNVQLVDKAESKVLEDMGNCADNIEQFELGIKSNETVLQNTKEDLAMLLEGEDTQKRDERIEEINAEIKAINAKVKVAQAKVIQSNLKLTNTKSELAKTKANKPEKQLQNLQQQKLKAKELVDEINAELRQINDLRAKLSLKTGKVVACPNCGFEFIPDEEMTVEETLEIEGQLNEAELEQKVKLQATEVELKALNKKIEQLENVQGKIQSLEDSIWDLEESIRSANESIQTSQESSAVKVNMIDALQNRDDSAIIKNKRKQITETEQQINNLKQQLEQAIQQREDLQFLAYHFGKSGFKTYLANKSIKNIQDINNWYLKKFNIDLQVYISGYKTLANGELREKIDVWVVEGGVNKSPFSVFSGGERARVVVCNILALQRLINNSSTTGGLDLLLLDEYMASLDPEGQVEVVKILAASGVTSSIIMHHADSITHANKVYVKKIDKVSKIFDKPYKHADNNSN